METKVLRVATVPECVYEIGGVCWRIAQQDHSAIEVQTSPEKLEEMFLWFLLNKELPLPWAVAQELHFGPVLLCS